MKTKLIYLRPDAEMMRLDSEDVFATSTGATNENFIVDDDVVEF